MYSNVNPDCMQSSSIETNVKIFSPCFLVFQKKNALQETKY